jgi:hypothetical protein
MSAQLYSGIYLYDASATNLFFNKVGTLGGSDTLKYNNLVAGVYYIDIINWSNGYGSYNLKLNFYQTTFVSDPIVNNFPISIYPNPNNGKFTLKSNNINSIEIYNMLGNKVYTLNDFKRQTTNWTGQASNEIDLSNFQKGIYFVKIYDGQKTQTKKIVIQ